MQDYTKINSTPNATNAGSAIANRNKALVINALINLALIFGLVYFVLSNSSEPTKTMAPSHTNSNVSALTETRFENQSLSLAQAYRLTNVDKVPFSDQKNSIQADESRYLAQLFILTDILVIERVQNYRTQNYRTNNYKLTLEEIKNLTPPPSLSGFHKKIVGAVETQITYFSELANGRGFNASDNEVQTSHSALLSAYDEVMSKYSNQSDAVKRSFFSQLCALDLI